MDYSAAVKGNYHSTMDFILSQAEQELGHPLTEEEKGILFSSSSQESMIHRIQTYGFGTIKFKMFLCKRPEFKCDISPNAIPRDGNCLFHAISDGILNNEALKHNGNDTSNKIWTEVLQDLKFFGNEDNHIMYLRTRFVLGASELMAGCNGSKQNDKVLFDYTDQEWQHIWMTILEDGAWAVPSIKDNAGKTIKENWAPEILIKYIAHELKCHIIVFDLLLDTVQFISGNHVKDNNVVFDSPLLMYSTGGHFQSVYQQDQEFFIKYARDLELQNVQPDMMMSNSEEERKPQKNTKKEDFNNKLQPLQENNGTRSADFSEKCNENSADIMEYFTFNNFGTETVFEIKDNKFFCFGCNKWFERMKGHLKMSRNCQKIVDVNNFLDAIKTILQDRKRDKIKAYRQSKNAVEKELERKLKAEQMKKMRDIRTPERKQLDRNLAVERMKKIRGTKNPEEKERDRKLALERAKKIREAKTPDEKDRDRKLAVERTKKIREAKKKKRIKSVQLKGQKRLEKQRLLSIKRGIESLQMKG